MRGVPCEHAPPRLVRAPRPLAARAAAPPPPPPAASRAPCSNHERAAQRRPQSVATWCCSYDRTARRGRRARTGECAEGMQRSGHAQGGARPGGRRQGKAPLLGLVFQPAPLALLLSLLLLLEQLPPAWEFASVRKRAPVPVSECLCACAPCVCACARSLCAVAASASPFRSQHRMQRATRSQAMPCAPPAAELCSITSVHRVAGGAWAAGSITCAPTAALPPRCYWYPPCRYWQPYSHTIGTLTAIIGCLSLIIGTRTAINLYPHLRASCRSASSRSRRSASSFILACERATHERGHATLGPSVQPRRLQPSILPAYKARRCPRR